jgi:ATP-dependent exoDNAse (exonuclease V) beta subunit
MHAPTTPPILKDLLTVEQEIAASRREGSMLLAAAAGSGKTSVLVERYVRAVLDDELDPARILAITFTERAAWELKERIRVRLQDLGCGGLARDAEASAIGTIHGFCARLLRADPLAAGLSPSFTILEEATAARMRTAAFTDALGAAMRDAAPADLDAAAAYMPDRLRQIVSAAYAELRSRGQARPALPAAPVQGPQDALAAHALLGTLLSEYGAAYDARKHSRSAVDFDDLELLALQLLGWPQLRTRWMERFDMLMVDEFQDTNRRQLALLSAIEGENLFTVGDEWQSIYGFRHAEVEIFRRREDELAGGGASLALTRNFRSRPGIIDAVNAVFGRRFGERFNPLVAAREPAEGGGPCVEVLLTDARGWEREEPAQSAPAWRQAEARLIARRLRALVRDGKARPGEIALLLRSMTDLGVYEAALRDEGLPTCSVSAELWEAQDVQDVLCGLRALANPLDELALHGMLAGPDAALSAGALWQLSRAVGEDGRRRGLWEAICEASDRRGGLESLPAADGPRLVSFRERFERERRRAGDRTLATLIRRLCPACAQSGIEPANVRRLMALARDFEVLEGRDLRGFIKHLEHLAQTRSAVGSPTPQGEPEAVRLMSIHAAKGLEFPVVCVADLGRTGNGREAPYLLMDGERVGLRVAHLDGSAPEPAFDYDQLARARDMAQEHEEDRVIYVAMTRAREILLLSGAASFERWPKDLPGCAPIAWIAPALIEDLPARLAGADRQPAASSVSDSASQIQPAYVLCSPAGAGVAERSRCGPAARPPAGRAPTDRIEPSDALDGRLSEPQTPELEVGQTLSYTALSELERCGYRYYLERVLRLPQASSPLAGAHSGGGMDRARAVGDLAHRLMERFDFVRGRDPGVEEVAHAAGEMDIRIDSSSAQKIARMLGGLRATPFGRRLAGARVLHTEQPFGFTLHDQEILIAGVFDAIATERDGACLVIDYKTGVVSAREDLEALVARDYELQRLTYALATLRDGARAVEVVHWYLHRPGEPVAARFTAAQLGELEALLGDRVRTARQRGFLVSQAPHRRLCGTCPGRAGLCSWPQSVTDSEHPPG